MSTGRLLRLSMHAIPLLPLLIAGAAAAAPPAGIPPDILAAAQKEGRASVYTVLDEETMSKTVAAFNKDVPGITVQVLVQTSGPLSNRVAAEVNSGARQADIVDVSATKLYTDHPDWWRPLSPDVIPTLAHTVPDVSHGNFVNTLYTPHLIAYNKNLVTGADVPKIWTDVLNPKFQGKGLLVDPRATNTYMSWLDLMDRSYGDDFLVKLRAQNFKIVTSAAQGAQEVAAGGRLLVLPVGMTHSKPVMDRGGPLGLARPWENSSIVAAGPVISWGILKNAPHPNAALVFLTWLLSPTAQKMLCSGANASWLLPDNDRGTCLPQAPNFVDADFNIPADRQAKLLGLLGIR